MSEWRRKAVADFPEYRAEIEHAQSAHGVFFEFLPALQDAYRTVPPQEARIRRIYAYARWCLEPARHQDVRGAAMASFFEHLPDFGPAWRDLPLRVDARELADIRDYIKTYQIPANWRERLAELDVVSRSLPICPPAS